MSGLSPRRVRVFSQPIGFAAGACFAAIASGQITYLNNLGDGSTANNQFADPRGVAVDSSGDVYVADTGNQRIQIFNTSGVYLSTIGTTGTKGSGNNLFDNPYAVAVDSSGNVYVADTSNDRVQIFNSSGTYLSTIGTTDMRGSGDNQLAAPVGVAVNPSGDIYVADTLNQRIQIFNSSDTYLSTIGTTGTSGAGNNQLDYPYGAAVGPSGNIYVADTNNDRVQVFNSSGIYQSTIGTTDSYGAGNDQFAAPDGVAVGATGNVYVADTANQRVQVFNSSGGYLNTISGFSSPEGVAIGANGMLYVADAAGDSIDRYFDPSSWVSGTDIFTDPTIGPTSIALGTSGGSLTINSSMNLIVGDTTTINTGSILTLNGGSIFTNTLTVNGTLVYQSGALSLSTLNVGSGGNFQAVQGGSITQIASLGISNGGNMNLDGGATLNASTVSITAGGLLTMEHAALISSGGISLANGGEIQLGNSTQSIIQSPTVTNGGTIDGSGEIVGSLQNGGGQLIVNSAQTIAVTGAGNVNFNGGLIALAGGTLHFTQDLTNYPGSIIAGFGSLYVNGGLTNNGIVTLGGGAAPTSVFGAINNSTANASGAAFNLAGSAYIYGVVTADASTSFHLSNGSNVFYNSVQNNGNLQVDPGASGYFYSSYAGPGPVLDNGLLDFAANSTIGSVTGSGTIIIGSQSTPAVLVISPGGTINSVSDISINPGSKLDITGNTLTLDTSSPEQGASTILSELISAYNHGAWNGPGITSSLSVANAATALGYSITGNTFTIKYTWLGDTDLSGTVTYSDLQAMAPVGTKNATWANGDFNYDGVVNQDDYSLFMLGAAESGGMNISILLPDPAGASALTALIAPALLRRRRFKR